MKKYTVRKGKREDLKEMPAAAIDTALWGGSFGISATAALCYDEEAIYVRLSAKEKEIRSENTDPIREPCEDSCLEFFFRPEADDPRYMNVEFNPNGLLFWGIGTGIPDLIRLMPLENDPFGFKSERSKDGWTITYQIPHAFVRRLFPSYTARSGKKFYGNFYKCGDLTPHPHYLAWSPVTEGKTFHRPEDFGELVFE